jgi:hypothetical protein
LCWWCSSWSSYSSSLEMLWLLCVVFFYFYLYHTTPCTQFSPWMISNRSPFCGHVNWEEFQYWYVTLDWQCLHYIWCIISPNGNGSW